jgi:Ca2+-binding EF-hand superfamily protein
MDTGLLANEKTGSIVKDNFGSLWQTFITLFQFVTLDSIASVYTPLIMERPLLMFYFFPILFLVSLALMNVVNAIIVEGALTRAQGDREMQRRMQKEQIKKSIPKIYAAFDKLDSDGEGTLEFKEILDNHSVMTELADTLELEAGQSQIFNSSAFLLEFFDNLDVGGTGHITKEEFVEGLLLASLSHVPTEVMQILKLQRLGRNKLELLEEAVSDIKKSLSDMATRNALAVARVRSAEERKVRM